MDVSQKTISSVISDAMEAKGMTVEKLSEETGISDRFIDLLLSERYDDLPPAPYTHGYLIKISEVLELDGEEIWKAYLKDIKQIKKSGEFDVLPKNRFIVSKINKKVILGIVIFLIIAGYFIFRISFSSNIASELYLNNFDEDPLIVNEPEFMIEGTLDPGYQLSINQSPVTINTTGNFEKTITLEDGLNTVVFSVKGILGKEGEVVKQIFYREDGTSTSTTPTTTTPTTPTTPTSSLLDESPELIFE